MARFSKLLYEMELIDGRLPRKNLACDANGILPNKCVEEKRQSQMIPKQFDSISKADIEALIANETPESKSLEYKQSVSVGSDPEKKEFLADVTSFANGGGGDIVYGIEEGKNSEGKNTGIPINVLPMASSNVDGTKLRLEELIRNGVDPRLPLQIRGITGFGNDATEAVILLRIPKSFASPHVVKLKGSFRFYSRHSSGKYQLDVQELRSMFLATDSQSDRIRRFREERLGRITADETPVQLSSKQRLILHLIPFSTFLNNERLDLAQIRKSHLFYPLGRFGNTRFNLDGIVTHSTDVDDGKINDGYCQLYFNGAIETVSSSFVRGESDSVPNGGAGRIASIKYEKDVIDSVGSYLKCYATIGVTAPISISMALLGCKGSFIYGPGARFGETPGIIDRDVAILPDVVIEDLDVTPSIALKPIFDAVWNACGYPGSLNYDENGNWKSR